MYKRIFRSVCATALAVFALSLVFVLGMLSQYFGQQLEQELRTEASYLAKGIDAAGESFLDGLSYDDKRVTLIGGDGTVLYDSEANSAAMENHRDREEFVEAKETGVGESVRYSRTLMERTIYYALRLENGDVLRVSDVQESVLTVLLRFAQPVFVLILVVLGVSAFAASQVSHAIVRPLNSMDLDENPSGLEEYDELAPLFLRIEHQRATIEQQLEEAVKMREEFRLITENMTEGFLMIDRGTNLLTYNSAALRLLGVPEGATGKSVLILNRSEVFRTVVDESLAGRHAEQNMERSGRVYNLLANPVLDGERVIGAVIIILDVTESQQREQLRREFTANVSHELKTPLTSISGFAELMRTGTVPQEDVIDFSCRIYDETQRLITLVGDIIRLSELDERAQGGGFDREKVDVTALCEEIIDRLSAVADRRKVVCTIQAPESVLVETSRRILDEVIYNICDNAIKYNKAEGSVRITVTEAPAEVSIAVRDTGIGIPAEDQQRVFERFYRVDKSHSREIGGTGLGLSIVKHGAIALGASLHLESQEGVGTTVTLALPKLRPSKTE